MGVAGVSVEMSHGQKGIRTVLFIFRLNMEFKEALGLDSHIQAKIGGYGLSAESNSLKPIKSLFLFIRVCFCP